nr:hypothetical protein [Tanacetum cinerariifolium]
EKNGVAPSAKEKNEAVKDGVALSVKVASGNNTGTQEANSVKAGHDNLHGKNLRNGKRARPTAFEFVGKNLQTGVKKEDSVTNVKNTLIWSTSNWSLVSGYVLNRDLTLPLGHLFTGDMGLLNGKNLRNGKRARPTAFEFVGENLQTGVKKEDSVTNVKNTVLDF